MPIGYANADWGSDIKTRRSVTRILFVLCSAPIMWSSKSQKCIALSTTEAELNVLSEAAKHGIYLRKHIADFTPERVGLIRIYNDNQSSLILLTGGAPNFHRCMKHYDIKSSHLHKATLTGTLDLRYCQTEDMPADLLTKSLPRATIEHLCKLISLEDSTIFD